MCEITAGYTPPCDTTGGVRTQYAANLADIDTITVVAGAVTALTLKAGKFIYPFQTEIETTNFKSESTGERANKAIGYTETGTVKLFGNTAVDNVQLDLLAKGRTVWFVDLNDGTMEVYFRQNGAKAQVTRDTGTTFEDMNGNMVTLNGREQDRPPKIAFSLISANLAP